MKFSNNFKRISDRRSTLRVYFIYFKVGYV